MKDEDQIVTLFKFECVFISLKAKPSLCSLFPYSLEILGAITAVQRGDVRM